MRVKEWQGEVVFLHEVAPGAADRSYGIQVARLAGLPAAVVARAEEVLEALEKGEQSGDGPAGRRPAAVRGGAAAADGRARPKEFELERTLADPRSGRADAARSAGIGLCVCGRA